MNKDKLIFRKTASYEELVKLLGEQLPKISKYYFYEDAFEQAIASFNTSSLETRKRILVFANHVDSKMNFAGQAYKNRFHKIPTILAGSIYLDLYKESVSELTLDELEILAKYSITLPLMFYKMATMYYTKKLLALINEKGKDFMHQTGYMLLVEKFYGMGMSLEEIIEYFRVTSSNKLTKEAFKYEENKVAEEMTKHESRRF